MSIPTPQDEGDPVFTSTSISTFKRINGANFMSAMQLYVLGRTGGTSMEPFWFGTGGTAIHNRTSVDIALAHASGQLYLYNPVGYHSRRPNIIAQDLLRHQGHAGRGIFRRFPTRDQSVGGSWVATAGGPLWSKIDEGTDDPNLTDYATTTGINDVYECGFFGPTLPSNGDTIKEVRINMWAALQELGTGDGLALQLQAFHSAVSGSPGLGTELLPVGGYYAAHRIALVGNIWVFSQWRFQGTNLTKTQCESMELKITSKRFFAGAGASTSFFLAAIDIDLFTELTDIEVVDYASFDALDTHFSSQTPPYNLDGDFIDKRIEESVLEVVAHAPEMHIYWSNDNKVTCGLIPDLPGASTPYKIGPDHGNFIQITNTFKNDARLMAEAQINYNSKPTNLATPGVADSVNAELITSLIDDGEAWRVIRFVERGGLDRRLIRDPDIIRAFSANFLSLFPNPIPGVSVLCNHLALEVEENQVVELDIPLLGYDAKRYMVAEIEVDVDSFEVELILLDLSYTE